MRKKKLNHGFNMHQLVIFSQSKNYKTLINETNKNEQKNKNYCFVSKI